MGPETKQVQVAAKKIGPFQQMHNLIFFHSRKKISDRIFLITLRLIHGRNFFRASRADTAI